MASAKSQGILFISLDEQRDKAFVLRNLTCTKTFCRWICFRIVSQAICQSNVQRSNVSLVCSEWRWFHLWSELYSFTTHRAQTIDHFYCFIKRRKFICQLRNSRTTIQTHCIEFTFKISSLNWSRIIRNRSNHLTWTRSCFDERRLERLKFNRMIVLRCYSANSIHSRFFLFRNKKWYAEWRFLRSKIGNNDFQLFKFSYILVYCSHSSFWFQVIYCDSRKWRCVFFVYIWKEVEFMNGLSLPFCSHRRSLNVAT